MRHVADAGTNGYRHRWLAVKLTISPASNAARLWCRATSRSSRLLRYTKRKDYPATHENTMLIMLGTRTRNSNQLSPKIRTSVGAYHQTASQGRSTTVTTSPHVPAVARKLASTAMSPGMRARRARTIRFESRSSRRMRKLQRRHSRVWRSCVQAVVGGLRRGGKVILCQSRSSPC